MLHNRGEIAMQMPPSIVLRSLECVLTREPNHTRLVETQKARPSGSRSTHKAIYHQKDTGIAGHHPSPSFQGLYKAEVINRLGAWRNFEAVEFTALEWVNYRHLLKPIGNIPPADAKERYHAMLDVSAMAV